MNKPAASTGNEKAKPKKGWLGFTIIFMLLTPFFPATLLILAGMLPTLVVMLFDFHRERTKTITIGCINFVGVFFFIFGTLSTNQITSWQTILEQLTTPHVWLGMYTGAAVGWAIYFLIPPLISQIVIANAEAEVANMEKRMAKLVEEWGEDVKGSTGDNQAPEGGTESI